MVGHTESPLGWYRIIEPGIRRQVKLLRDHGFNTHTSCAHRMEVTLDASHQFVEGRNDLESLDELLQREGYRDYTILFRLERRERVPGLRTYAVVQFGDDRARHRISRRLRSLASWWWEAPPHRGEP